MGKNTATCAQGNDLSLEQQEELFDVLANDYDLLLTDWCGYQDEVCAILDRFFREYGKGKIRSVLDPTCGIGTQCIGLARLGYDVRGLDISGESVSRARQESAKAGFNIGYERGDIRSLDERFVGKFDAVISCDNSLPALLSRDDFKKGLESMFLALAPEGVCIASIRDYDQIFAERKRFHPRQIHEEDGKRTIIFDVWDYDGEEFVVFTVFFLRETASGWDVKTRRMVYRPVYRDGMIRALQDAGFTDVERVDSLDGKSLDFDYYLARKPGDP